MSETRKLSDFLKSLPAADTIAGKQLVVCNTTGTPERASSSMVVTKAESSQSSVTLDGGWIRVAHLGASIKDAYHFFGRVSIITRWGSTSAHIVWFDLFFGTARWDWNAGRATEVFAIGPVARSTPGLYPKARIVVEIDGTTGTAYLEVYCIDNRSDFRAPRVIIEPVTGTAKALTATAGSLPEGALAKEFDL